LAAEWLLSFALMFVIMAVATELYWLAPITGMIAAARMYDTLRETQPPRLAAEATPLGVQGPIRVRS